MKQLLWSSLSELLPCVASPHDPEQPPGGYSKGHGLEQLLH